MVIILKIVVQILFAQDIRLFIIDTFTGVSYPDGLCCNKSHFHE